MEHRAGPLLANRSLSALIVVSFVLSAFAGLYVIASPPQSAAQAPIGDLIVTSGTYTIENIEQAVDGDVTVSGGELIVRNGALKVISNVGNQRTVTVSTGGTLTMQHGELTSYLDQIDPWPFLRLVIDGGTVVASDMSVLRFPGEIQILNGGELVLRDSSIEALASADLVKYISGSPHVTMDSADDGPEIMVDDSNLMLFDSSIRDLPEYPIDGYVASNLTLAGSSTLLAVNSFISVDFGPALTVSDWYVHNVLVLEDTSHAYLYGCYFESYTGTYSQRAPAISAGGISTSPATPIAKGAADNTGQLLAHLASLDGMTYEVEAQETMAIDTWDVGGIADGQIINSATLIVTYTTSPTYAGTNPIQWAPHSGGYSTTGIVPVAGQTNVTRMYDLPTTTLSTVGSIRTMDLRFANNGGGGTGSVEFDRAWLLFTVGADVHIYRWLNVTVGDEYGVPIPDADITAVFTGATELEGQQLFYQTPTGMSAIPPVEVIDYLGRTSATVFVTDANGVATIPFLTDIVTNGGTSESLFVGSYAVTGTTAIGSTPFSSTETFSFPAYPAMASSDQHFDMTVDVEGISAESPDASRWLVVPPDLLIENMNYYHAGDVIVASDGTLTVRNSVFQLVQSYPYQRTVYVDGTASFIIEDSQLTSSLAINLIVKGSGTLHVINSVISGVNIVAMEDATIILDGATVAGSITTTWNSMAHVRILDSALAQAPVISGSTLCEVTNTSAPAITVTGGATALIYRWIHITVFDGSNYPLEGAAVYARFFYNDTFWASSVTDPSGVAKLNSLATILTSTGSTFVGNYKVNASFWSGGVEYTSDETVALGVLPYDQPLTENATFAVLRMSSLVLPDLSISSSSIWTTPSNAVLDTPCTITVRVSNIGAAPATNVVVRVYIGDTLPAAELLGSYTIPLVMPGSAASALVPWTPEVIGWHTVWAVVNPGPAFDERTFQNNVASTAIKVLDYADMTMDGLSFYLSGGVEEQTSIAGGKTISIQSIINNVGEAPVTNPEVQMTVTYGLETDIVYKTLIGTLAGGWMMPISIDYDLPEVTQDTVFNFQLSANPSRTVLESDYTNNNASGALTVLDIRPDFKVSVSDIYIQYGLENETEAIYGKTVTIVARVYNLGGTNPGNISIEFGTNLYPNSPIRTESRNIPAGHSVVVTVDYLINLTTGGTYTLYVFADSEQKYSEKNETNNRAEFDMDIAQLSVQLSLSLSTEYRAGESIFVLVDVNYWNSTDKVVELRGVSVELRDASNRVVVSSDSVYTNQNGQASFTLNIPSEAEGGTYTLVARVAGLTETGSATVEVHGAVSGMDIPLLVWILVIVAIVAVVVGFTLYTYVYGLGKLVECGECGEFIPAASSRCPKCGVEFEAGTMKCSECGAWVPTETTECPNCGVKFVGEEVSEEDYLEKMRKEYDEMVSKYRELAKAQLGRKFSDKTFEQWWIAQPIYISFEDWVAKEEGMRKEGPVACPVCGTLNPKEATVCSKCGTVFGAVGQAPPRQQQPPTMPPGAGPEQAQPPAAQTYQQPPPDQAGQQPPQAAAPKMVIRRPIDRKVVPKKVIKTPISGESESAGTEQDGGEQQ